MTRPLYRIERIALIFFGGFLAGSGPLLGLGFGRLVYSVAVAVTESLGMEIEAPMPGAVNAQTLYALMLGLLFAAALIGVGTQAIVTGWNGKVDK